MNGYVLTATGDEALAAFDEPGVRHASALDTGEGFVAFNGDVPAEGKVFENMESGFTWPFVRIRWYRPTPIGFDTFGLFTPEAFRWFPASRVVMASLVDDDMILAITVGRSASASWTAQETTWLDTRAVQQEHALV